MRLAILIYDIIPVWGVPKKHSHNSDLLYQTPTLSDNDSVSRFETALHEQFVRNGHCFGRINTPSYYAAFGNMSKTDYIDWFFDFQNYGKSIWHFSKKGKLLSRADISHIVIRIKQSVKVPLEE